VAAALPKSSLNLAKAAELRVDRAGELAFSGRALCRAPRIFQKNEVIAMTAGVVAHPGSNRVRHFAQIGDQLFHIEREQRGLVFKEVGGVCDVA